MLVQWSVIFIDWSMGFLIRQSSDSLFFLYHNSKEFMVLLQFQVIEMYFECMMELMFLLVFGCKHICLLLLFFYNPFSIDFCLFSQGLNCGQQTPSDLAAIRGHWRVKVILDQALNLAQGAFLTSSSPSPILMNGEAIYQRHHAEAPATMDTDAQETEVESVHGENAARCVTASSCFRHGKRPSEWPDQDVMRKVSRVCGGFFGFR